MKYTGNVCLHISLGEGKHGNLTLTTCPSCHLHPQLSNANAWGYCYKLPGNGCITSASAYPSF
eukprot:1150049-Pelagomonas_calceolata.AAC.2